MLYREIRLSDQLPKHGSQLPFELSSRHLLGLQLQLSCNACVVAIKLGLIFWLFSEHSWAPTFNYLELRLV